MNKELILSLGLGLAYGIAGHIVLRIGVIEGLGIGLIIGIAIFHWDKATQK